MTERILLLISVCWWQWLIGGMRGWPHPSNVVRVLSQCCNRRGIVSGSLPMKNVDSVQAFSFSVSAIAQRLIQRFRRVAQKQEDSLFGSQANSETFRSYPKGRATPCAFRDRTLTTSTCCAHSQPLISGETATYSIQQNVKQIHRFQHSILKRKASRNQSSNSKLYPKRSICISLNI